MKGQQQKQKRQRRLAPKQKAGDIAARPPVIRYTKDVFGFPDRLLVKLRYADNITLTSTTGAIGSNVFRMNSIFDPDHTGTGHQPLYHDIYAQVYSSYAVVSTNVFVQFINPTSAPFMTYIGTDDNAAPSTTYQNLIEESHAQSDALTPVTGSHSETKYRMKWSAAKWLNIDPFSSDYYKAAFGTNPVQMSYLSVSASTMDSSSNSLIVRVILEYQVLLSELITIAQS